jgi:hypothetical protein
MKFGMTDKTESNMPAVASEIRCEEHDRSMSLVANVAAKAFREGEANWTMYQCLVQGCTRYYCESLGGYLRRSEKGTFVPIVPVKEPSSKA